MKRLFPRLRILALCLPALAFAAGDDETLSELQNPGYEAKPAWFKNSFLDIREDVAEATEAGKRVILYFYQDGCPYCDQAAADNFGDRDISATAREDFDVIAINLWGDREVTGTDGSRDQREGFRGQLGVQYTPTMLLLDEERA